MQRYTICVQMTPLYCYGAIQSRAKPGENQKETAGDSKQKDNRYQNKDSSFDTIKAVHKEQRMPPKPQQLNTPVINSPMYVQSTVRLRSSALVSCVARTMVLTLSSTLNNRLF